MKQKIAYSSFVKIKSKIHICPLPEDPTRVGFEPTRAEHNGLAVHRLNHSATSSHNTGIVVKRQGADSRRLADQSAGRNQEKQTDRQEKFFLSSVKKI